MRAEKFLRSLSPRHLALASFVAFALNGPASAAEPGSLCTPQGYTVGFFNGVWNTQADALSGLQALRGTIGDTKNDEPIEYTLFYNDTGSEVGASGRQDLAEVFIQRALEYDASGELGRRFEYFWEAAGNTDHSFFERVVNTMGAELGILDGIATAIITQSVAGWSMLLSDPPTLSNYTEHRAQLDSLSIEGQKLLLVAHSQGNLFVNQAYDYVEVAVGSNSVKTLHIAPASPTTRGEHILADIDVVINGLRVQGIGSVPPININLPFSSRDPSGHTLVDTYLDPSRAARARIRNMADSALASLESPENDAAIASRGFFTVTLTWDGDGDVDLHVREPLGTDVGYFNKQGYAGYLDVDNTWAYGPEHYFASCNPAGSSRPSLQTGNYRIGINNYADATGRTATVQISFAQGGQPLTRVLNVGPEMFADGNGSNSIYVANVKVTEDADGHYSAEAN